MFSIRFLNTHRAIHQSIGIKINLIAEALHSIEPENFIMRPIQATLIAIPIPTFWRVPDYQGKEFWHFGFRIAS
jgi:hypothetical protein